MKVKRIVAWLLICVLQLGVCLLIPLRGVARERMIAQNGESCRFAVRRVTRVWDERESEVNLDFPPTVPFEQPKEATESFRPDTVIRELKTDADGLTRVHETAISYEELEQRNAEGYQDPPLYNLYGQDAALLVSDDVFRALDDLAQIMDDLSLCSSLDGTLSDVQRARLQVQANAIGEPALRDLAHRQITAENGDELFDSYVTGVVYQGEIYLREVWVAGIHVASLHD